MMELNQIVNLQIEMDEQHGFPVKFESDTEKYSQLTKDLVGLFGEVGEFSNVLKKINIKIDHPDQYELSLSAAEAALTEELVDSLIYIIRIGAILGIDLQMALMDKMKKNSVRYERLQKN
jgi:NTP pyrophosphatase (non-canonical NTP hydrolase)